jgi:Rod binding domain-containing protein
MIDAGLTATLMNQLGSRAGEGAAALGRVYMAGDKALTATQADAVAKDFESMFIAQMLDQMFGESLGTELFGDDETNDVYKGLMMEQYGKEIAAAGGIGIADYVKREMLKLQEV